ncbi:MAG: hypothetical protein HOP29_08535 [Phycisphaerales bacterium]|nr:hypothetical protein [Phycisphaerales bacterium]
MKTIRRLQLANRELAARAAGFDAGLRELSAHLATDKFRAWPYVHVGDVDRWIEWIRSNADAIEQRASRCRRCGSQPAGDHPELRCDQCHAAVNAGGAATADSDATGESRRAVA